MKRRSNTESNAKPYKPGGVTGKGFRPGKSGNPRGLPGRPRTRGLLAALKAELGIVGKDGRTTEQQLAAKLVHEALKGRYKRAAIAEIFDRIEGKPKQQLDVNDITQQMQGRSNEELMRFAETGKWEPSE